MTYAVRYHPLFRIRIRELGTDKGIQGIRCRPTRRSVIKLRNHRLVFKAAPSGFDVFFSTNPLAGNAVMGRISPLHPVVLSFAMVADTPAALSAYEPIGEANESSQFYLDNLLADGSLHAGTDSPMSTGASVSNSDAVRMYGHEFSLRASDVAGAAKVQIRHLVTNRVALQQPLNLDPEKVDLSRPAIDMRNAEPGPYKIAPNPNPAAQDLRKIYVDDELVRGNTVAAIDVHWRSLQDPATQIATYVVSFKPRAP